MEEFVHQLQSPAMPWIIGLGLALVGFGMGLLSWVDFRRRFPRGGRAAGWIALIAGTLLGTGAGYLATQPGYFKALAADAGGIRLDYGPFARGVFLAWDEVQRVDIRNDRLLIATRSGDRHRSMVVYRGDQQALASALAPLRATR
jgi:hypothetical protein